VAKFYVVFHIQIYRKPAQGTRGKIAVPEPSQLYKQHFAAHVSTSAQNQGGASKLGLPRETCIRRACQQPRGEGSTWFPSTC